MIDFDAVLAELRALGYDGWVGLEYAPSGGDTLASLDALRARGWLGG